MSRQVKAAQFVLRLFRVEDDQRIALAPAGVVAVGHPWTEQAFLDAALLPVGEDGLRLLREHRLVILAGLPLGLAKLPLAGEQGIAIEEAEDVLDVDGVLEQDLTAPEGGLEGRLFRHAVGAVR